MSFGMFFLRSQWYIRGMSPSSASNRDPRWYLKGSLSDGSPWIVPLHDRTFSIGRSAECSLILDAPDISRRHTLIRIEGTQAFVSDLGSRNGTFLNGAAVESRRQMENGDLLKVGRLEFAVVRGGNEAESVHTVIESAAGSDLATRSGLTPRETEVLYLLVRGDAVKEIARKLFISSGTAKNHVLKIYAKTGCHSRVELVNRHYEYESEG